MKKLFFLAAVATMTLASCMNDEFIGTENSPTVANTETDAINFGNGFKAVTRADHVGADAASLLGSRFIVGGWKTADATDYNLVFDNYAVTWAANTAGQTESNTSDWEYVGITGTSLSPKTNVTTQTIKYWDYSTASYDFVAYSVGGGTEIADTYTSGKVAVSKITHATGGSGTTGYSLEADRAELLNCYIADMVTVNKAAYGNEVELQFRSLASKVRMAIYETVPGYKVKEVKFYNAHPTTLGTGSGTTATLIGDFCKRTKFTVDFSGNVAHVTMDANPSTSTPYADYFDAYQGFGSYPQTAIGTTSQTATFAPGTESLASNYTRVLPNENGQVLELAVDYTLESDDATAEEINVYGATAYIPLQYTQWLANYAYTYIFKISNNTNGWTSTTDTDPAGLYPITFDAIVLNSETTGQQTTITTVASPSITTYQKGHRYDTDGPEYNAGSERIYVQVMVDGVLKGDLNSKGCLYTVAAGTTEADVMDAINIQSTSPAAVPPAAITGRNGVSLTVATSADDFTTIPREDGTNITITGGQAESFAATAGTYAYVYDTDTYTGAWYTASPADIATTGKYYSDAKCTTNVTSWDGSAKYLYQKNPTYIYSYEATASQPSDWGTDGVWYEDPDGLTCAYGSTWSSTKKYYKKYTVNHKVYGVKVITVV